MCVATEAVADAVAVEGAEVEVSGAVEVAVVSGTTSEVGSVVVEAGIDAVDSSWVG